MAFNSSTISVGSTTKKSHFDQLLDNTKFVKSGTIDILTTVGDLLAKGSSTQERIAPGASSTILRSLGTSTVPVFAAFALGIVGIKMGTFDKNSSGDLVISGIGFEPSLCIFLAADQTQANINWSIGFDDGDSKVVLRVDSDGTQQTIVSGSSSMIVFRAAGNYIQGLISAKGPDGFTITFTEVGTATIGGVYIALP